jgi:3-deoxy-D-manno-octulosonate 8-phosphate phosphatase (KDO 8-P phosphatase)
MTNKVFYAEQMLFMGDDLPDIQVMKEVGLPVCPADGSPEVKEISKFVSEKPGGQGAVRDVIERVPRVQGKWMTAEAYAW